MNQPIIALTFDEHRNRGVVSLRFAKDFALISKVKTIPGAGWSHSKTYGFGRRLSPKATETQSHVSKKQIGNIAHPLDDFG
jgi:hypothetical protein